MHYITLQICTVLYGTVRVCMYSNIERAHITVYNVRYARAGMPDAAVVPILYSDKAFMHAWCECVSELDA